MVNIAIDSNNNTYKAYELEMKVVTAGAVTYDVFGEVKDSLKILPSLAMITTSDIDAMANVYEIQDEVITVSDNITSVTTVSDSIANVNITVNNITNVNIVGEDIANVNTVASNIVGLNSIVSNMPEILLADDNAAIATTKALESSDSAYASLQSALDSAASAALFPNHIADTTNPHEVTKSQVGLEFSENTADIDKVVASAGKLTSPVNISLSGYVSGSVSFDGSNNVSIATTIAANSIVLGTDTTGNYVAGNTAGTGISITGTAGEGWSPTIALTNVGEAGTYRSVTTDSKGRITAGTNPTTLAGYGITDAYTKAEVNNSLALKINNSEKGVANGVATLDVNGKVVLTQIPDSVLGQLEYMGTWNFTTMPTAAQKGQYWIASTSGNGYVVGDWAVWNGTALDKVDNTDAVATVAGRTGNVVLTKTDVGLANVDNTSDANKPISTATQTALDLKANRASPALTGAPTAPTAVVGTNTTVIATTAFVNAEIANDAVPRVTSTDNAIVRFNGTTGDVQNSGVIIDDNGNVGIGTSSPISKLSISGYLNSQDSNNNGALYLGQYLNGNGAYGGFEWNNTAGILSLRAQGAYPITFLNNNTERMRIDSSGNVLLTSSTGGLGYGTGAGGTVTQLTSKSTAVTLNKPSGQITMNNAALAAGASVLFPFYNSTCDGNYDQLIVNMHSVVGGYNNYKVENAGTIGGGGQYIRLTNISGISLSESPSIKFTVIKGAAS